MSTESNDNPPMVLMPDGRVVPGIRTDLDPDECTPGHLIRWIERIEKSESQWPARMIKFKRKLCEDKRMADFWEWIASVRFNRLDRFRSSYTVSSQIYYSTRMPGKPGNMTPAKREAYFKKVRHHASSLRALIEGTRFDNLYQIELRDDQLNRTLDDALSTWGIDEPDDGHIVAFQVTRHGKFEHHYAYPENALAETLFAIIDWTCWEDSWDGGIWSTSAPIVQAKGANVLTIYFCCTLHDWFASNGVEIPFPILATVANVALDLPADGQLDDEAARKQVRRYQERQAKRHAEHPESSANVSAGQNFADD